MQKHVFVDILKLIYCKDCFKNNKILYLSPQALCKASSFYVGIYRNKQNQFSTVHSCDHWNKAQGLGAASSENLLKRQLYFTTGPLGLMLIIFKWPVSYSSGLKLPLISNPINICLSLNYFIVLISIYLFIIPSQSVAIYGKEK